MSFDHKDPSGETGLHTEPRTLVSEGDLDLHPWVELRPFPVRVGPLEFNMMQALQQKEQELQIGHMELEALKERAREQGYLAGKEQALGEVLQLWKERMDAWEQKLQADRDSISRKLPELAAALAASALGRELSMGPQALADMVQTLLGDSVPMETVTLVHAHGDAGRFDALKEVLSSRYSHVNFVLQARSDVPPGQVVMETATFRLDGRLSTWELFWKEELERTLHGRG